VYSTVLGMSEGKVGGGVWWCRVCGLKVRRGRPCVSLSGLPRVRKCGREKTRGGRAAEGASSE
jgi:hypothetical protein